MPAPEVVYYVASSLDGYIATIDGGVKWLAPFEGGGEDYGYAEFYASVDAVLLGRRTYEQSLGFGEWPYPGKPCWVFSRQRLAPARPAVQVTDRLPAQVLDELASRGLRRAWLVGGGALASSFRTAGLITEYVVALIPVVLGEGIPLLAPSSLGEPLELAGSRSYANGVVQLRYLRSAPR